MKKFLPLILSLGGGALLLGSLYAANTPAAPAPAAAPALAAPKAGPAKPMLPAMGEKLGLTDEQKKKLETIRTEQRAALDAVRNDQALTPADKRAKARGLVESYRGQMKAVLTAEQQQKMAQVRDRIMERRQQFQQRQAGLAGRRGGPQNPGPGPQGFGFAQQPGQPGPASPMDMIQQGNRMAAEGHRQLARQLGLTEEQSNKIRDLTRQQQEKAQALQKEFRDQMLSVLTPEQQEKAKALREHQGAGPRGERPDRGRPGPAPDMPSPGR